MYIFDLQVDNKILPPPSAFNLTEADLHANPQRNAQGYASWDLVRKNVASLELEWKNLDGERLTRIITAIRGKKSFRVKFFNTLTGKYEIRTFYPGDRATELVRFVSAVKYWATLKVPFVEV